MSGKVKAKENAGGISNILYLNPTSKMSGAEFSLLALLEKIDQRRFHPILLLPEVGPFSEKAIKIDIETLILPSMIRFEEGYHVDRIPKIVRSLFQIRKIIKSKGIRLVHSNSPRTAYLGGMAARLSSVPSVTHVRDIHFSPFSHPLKAKLLSYLSDVIVTVSCATKDFIVERTPSLKPKIRVVYNGVNIERLDRLPRKNIRQELGIEDDVPIIGSVGLLHPVKGHDVLIRAAALLKNSFPSLRVLIVGEAWFSRDESYRKKLERLAKDQNLEDSVILTGFREDVFDVMRAMDVLVHPAVYPDPLPRTLLEGCALRKAIVATNVGGVPEIVDHDISGLLIEPSNPEIMASAIGSLLRDKKKAVSLASEARRKAERFFSIEQHVENIMAIYEGMLSSGD